ncbi:NERD domain-containing protein [Nocardiopsis sp. NPDC006198]|uniref:nuclease-related domain-containing DEAD/DEAH box helicase n=1 Tax=Nocardiopsis sp. NPDC006198 TaxID=3154472 RepID=UPI0033BF2562
MQMIPDDVRQDASQAEKRIFEELRATTLPGWDFAFHQLNIPEHRRKRVCEADFVLVGERGLLVLEVKGGQVSCKDRVWHTRNLSGKRHRLSESPLQQARSAHFALEKLLGRELGSDLVGQTIFGHGVVFPDVDFDVPGVEWDRAQIIDRRDIEESGWARELDRMGTYWESKPGSRRSLTEAETRRYLALLRPRFDLVPKLMHLSRDVERELVTLTRNQYRALDKCSRNPRLLYEGGAGTGKTMLAAEMSRREAHAGSRVLLTCRSGVLARFLRSQPGLEKVDVRPFHTVSDLNSRTFDLVVVDEAQDVINRADLQQVDRVLDGGLENGKWTFLLDSNNQRGLVGQYEDDAMAVLRGHRPAEFTLTENCRNTVQIVTATQERTGADLGATSVGQGLEVVSLELPRTALLERLASELDLLEEQQVPLDQVVLLSPFPLGTSVFGALPGRWRDRVDVLDLARLRNPTKGRIGFAKIADFKGLEGRFVFLEFPPTFVSEDVRRAQLYVGMTRARTALWVAAVVDQSTQESA